MSKERGQESATATEYFLLRRNAILCWILPVFTYGVLHGLGHHFPASLWGVDQLHYYSPSVTLLFATTLALCVLLALKPDWTQHLDASLEPPLSKSLFTSVGFQLLLGLLFVAAALLFRDRQHFLGDGAMWLSTFELLIDNPEHGEISWIDSPFTGAGLQYMPFSESLSAFIRFQFFALAHQTFGLDKSIAHELLSCLAGFPYAILCLHLAATMAAKPLDRAALFLLCLAPATTQFYFGYVESYTLPHLAAAAYVYWGLRFLRGGSFWAATLAMLIATASHLMVLATVPSWFYLLWRRLDRPGYTWSQNPRIYLPTLGLIASAGIALYPHFYPYSMGFLTPREEGMYALFSADHLALLANALLLLSPFGLLWTLHWLAIYIGDRGQRPLRANPDIAFLGWASAGSLGLAFFHDAYLGARDWDVLALPVLFYTLLGYAALCALPAAAESKRLLRWCVLPIALLHTALWIGINADQQRALDRLGNLLQRSGYALHSQAFALGHYYLNLRQDDYDQAILYLRRAIELSPSQEMTEAKGYPTFLSKALHNAGVQRHTNGDYAHAIAAYREAIQLRPDYAIAWRNLGLALQETELFDLALAAHRAALRSDPKLIESLYDVGMLYNQLGQYREAASAYAQKLRLDSSDVKARYNLGMTYLQLGEQNAAREQYQHLRLLDRELAEKMAPHIYRSAPPRSKIK